MNEREEKTSKHDGEDIDQFKARVMRIVLAGRSQPVRDWVAQCALSAYENGDIDDDVFDVLEHDDGEGCDELAALRQQLDAATHAIADSAVTEQSLRARIADLQQALQVTDGMRKRAEAFEELHAVEASTIRQQLAEKDKQLAEEIDRTHKHTVRIIMLENKLAAQAAELERLRKAASGLLAMMDEIPDYPDGCQNDRVFAEFEFDELRAALGEKP